MLSKFSVIDASFFASASTSACTCRSDQKHLFNWLASSDQA